MGSFRLRDRSNHKVAEDRGTRFLVIFVGVLLVITLVGFYVLVRIRSVLQSDLPLRAATARPDSGVMLVTAAWILLVVIVLIVGIVAAVSRMKRL